MSNIKKREDGTVKVTLFLRKQEHDWLRKLADKMDMNEFDALKYALQLVSWWSKNEIEPSDHPADPDEEA